MKVLDPILWSTLHFSTPLRPNHRRHTFTTAATVCLGCGLSLNITCETYNLHWALRVTCTIEMFVTEAVAFMKRIQADLNVIPACKYGMNVYKRWLFVSGYRELRALSGCCQHEPNAHMDIRCKRDASGKRLSKLTAEFPAQLCTAYACTCVPLFSLCDHPCDIQICQLPYLNPIKKANEMPRACQDGGGIHSLPDWSVPRVNCPDVMKDVRQPLFALLLQWHAPQRLKQHVQEQ